MPARSPLPHGSRPTPVASEPVVRPAARLQEVAVDGEPSCCTQVWGFELPEEGIPPIELVRPAG